MRGLKCRLFSPALSIFQSTVIFIYLHITLMKIATFLESAFSNLNHHYPFKNDNLVNSYQMLYVYVSQIKLQCQVNLKTRSERYLYISRQSKKTFPKLNYTKGKYKWPLWVIWESFVLRSFFTIWSTFSVSRISTFLLKHAPNDTRFVSHRLPVFLSMMSYRTHSLLASY